VSKINIFFLKNCGFLGGYVLTRTNKKRRKFGERRCTW